MCAHLRTRQLRDARPAARHRRRRHAAGPLRRRDRPPDRGVRRLHARRLARLAAVSPLVLDADDHPDGALDVARDRGLRRLARRVRAHCRRPAVRDRGARDGLGRRRLPRRRHAGPAGRPRRERAQRDRPADRAARPAARRLPAQHGVAARDRRGLYRVRHRPGDLGTLSPSIRNAPSLAELEGPMSSPSPDTATLPR